MMIFHSYVSHYQRVPRKKMRKSQIWGPCQHFQTHPDCIFPMRDAGWCWDLGPWVCRRPDVPRSSWEQGSAEGEGGWEFWMVDEERLPQNGYEPLKHIKTVVWCVMIFFKIIQIVRSDRPVGDYCTCSVSACGWMPGYNGPRETSWYPRKVPLWSFWWKQQ